MAVSIRSSTMNAEDLIKFEKEIEGIYEQGHIKAPIHLRCGNEKQLVEIFKEVGDLDYVFSTWASHMHALLKGVCPDKVKKNILDGKSITLHFPENNFYSSAIVGGICPIAVGRAFAIGNREPSPHNPRVHCFLGDMSFLTGIASESIRYSLYHDLPITWVIEDNGVSVGTVTEEVWGGSTEEMFLMYKNLSAKCENFQIKYYRYSNSYPHSGTGVFVEF